MDAQDLNEFKKLSNDEKLCLIYDSVSQVKGHERRLAALEKWRTRLNGMGAAAIGILGVVQAKLHLSLGK